MPAIRRNVKKVTYALIFALIIFIPIAFMVLPQLLRRPDTPTTPDINPVAVEVEQVTPIIRQATADIVARIRNPNPRAGIPEFTVNFILKDQAGNEITRLPHNTYLLPGSLNYITALDVPLDSQIAEASVEVPNDPRFIAIADPDTLPSFNSFLRDRTTRTTGPSSVEVQTGVVTNTSTLGYRRVDITAIAFDSANNIVGIGQTFIGNFQVGEQREFTVQWPQPLTPTQRVIVLPATNIFTPDNILRSEGDPAGLR